MRYLGELGQLLLGIIAHLKFCVQNVCQDCNQIGTAGHARDAIRQVVHSIENLYVKNGMTKYYHMFL